MTTDIGSQPSAAGTIVASEIPEVSSISGNQPSAISSRRVLERFSLVDSVPVVLRQISYSLTTVVGPRARSNLSSEGDEWANFELTAPHPLIVSALTFGSAR